MCTRAYDQSRVLLKYLTDTVLKRSPARNILHIFASSRISVMHIIIVNRAAPSYRVEYTAHSIFRFVYFIPVAHCNRR